MNLLLDARRSAQFHPEPLGKQNHALLISRAFAARLLFVAASPVPWNLL
jgi:hypothetical protein